MPRPRPDGPRLERYRGRWCIVWWDGGTRRRISTGTTDERRARQSLADFETKLERRPLKLSFSEALDRYVTHRKTKIIDLARLKEAVVALKRGLGDLRVDQINQTQWDKYAAHRVTQPPARSKDPTQHKPRPVSPGTLRREFNVLRAALRRTWKDGFLDKPPEFEAPPDSAPRDRFITKAEARKLLAACVSPHVRVFAAVALFTGARKASILSLTWGRVNFETGIIDFNEPGRRLTNKRRAIVPINASLLPELETARGVALSEYVVEYNGAPVPTGLRWSFRRLCIRAGLNWVPTPHHIKHSVASWFAMESVPIGQAADWLATDEKTLRRVYRKFDPAYLRSAGRALDL
jgi:integrase